jgi:hypothetical protein
MMKKLSHIFPLLLCLVFAACDSTDPAAGPVEEELVAFAASHIEEVNVTPIAGKESSEFRIELKVRGGLDGVRLPDAINILAQGPGLENVAIFDDGRGIDRKGRDGVYTGVIPSDCIAGSTTRGGGAVMPRFKIGCKVQIVGPGGVCGEWGKCPESVHRSLLWGLIEYDTDVVVCVCLIECTFTSK